MTVELWSISETDQFAKDLLHFQVRESSMEVWLRNLQRNPMIGEPVDSYRAVQVCDYDVGEFIIRYLLVPPPHRHIELMMLRRAEEDDPTLGERLSKSRQLLLDIIAIWSGIKPS